MKNLIIVIIALVNLISFTSCSDFITGEGMVVKQTLDVNEFSKFELDASFDVVIQQGNEQKVEAEGQQNIIDRIQTSVSGDRFTADLENGNYRNIELTLFITTPWLSEIKSDGSGDIEIESLDGDNLTFDLDGSGNIVVRDFLKISQHIKITNDGSGNIKINDLDANKTITTIDGSGKIEIEDGFTSELEVKLDGSGDAKLFDLESEVCIVNAQGSGDTQVMVTDELDVTMSGSGDVKYKGNPSINVTDNGSGDLINAN